MIKKKNILFCLFILCSKLICSQSVEQDSFYLKKLNQFTDINNDSLLFFAKKLQRSNNLCNVYTAINKEAKAYYQKGDLTLAKEKTLFVLENTKEKVQECHKKNRITALIRLFWIYKNQNQFQDAFEVLLRRRDVIKSLNTKDNYFNANLISTEHNLAIIKSILGFDEEARNLLKQILPKLPEVYEDSDKGNYFLKLNISSTLNIIGETYLKTSIDENKSHLDSASVYFKKAYEVAQKFDPPHKNSETLYQLREVEVLIGKNNYKKAIELINRYKKNSNEFKTSQNINSLKAICYYKLNEADSSFFYCNQFLNNYNKKPNIKKKLIAIYDILANQYYNNQQLDSAYKYSELTIRELNFLNKNKNEVNKAYYLYDYKNAKALNTSILQKERKNKLSYLIIGGVVTILVVLSILFLLKKNRKIKLDFKDIEAELEDKTPQKKEYNIDEDLEKTLLKGIEDLKNSDDFLNSDFNINVLAKKLNTNTSYLSYLINKDSNQSFKQFITQLRIDYLITKLKEDSKFRNYTIKSLGEEIGYTNASAFTRVFKKYKGMTPSEFIKTLEEN